MRGGALRLVDAGLQLMSLLLVVGTVVLVPMVVYDVVTDSNELSIAVELTDRHLIQFVDAEGNPECTVSTGVSSVTGDERCGVDLADVSVRADLFPDDRIAHTTIAVALAAVVGLAWLIVLPLRRLVTAATQGRPFDPANPRRLRIAAGAAAGIYTAFAISARVIEWSVEAVSIEVVGRPGFWTTAAFVAVLLALAEVFRVGAELQTNDDLTV